MCAHVLSLVSLVGCAVDWRCGVKLLTGIWEGFFYTHCCVSIVCRVFWGAAVVCLEPRR